MANDNAERMYRDREGREWRVTLETPGEAMAVPPELAHGGVFVPQEEIRIAFTSGEERYDEEYTGLKGLDELSEDDLQEWLDAARQGEGI